MKHLLRDNHEEPAQQRALINRAIQIYRALLAGGVVEQLDQPDEQGRRARLTVDLQFDFALNQPLSPFALAAIDLLDIESPSYPLDVLSVIEATLDNPRQVLSAQQHKARGEAVNQMKADGIEYETRMELLESVTWPKPLEELLEHAYGVYRQGHPWVDDHELAPKSVVRDMYEQAMTFIEYIGHYGLSRSEGLVLRYLADAYKALRQTVPEDAKTEELIDLEEWLGELVRQVDSSLIDEWEQLRNPDADPAAEAERCSAGSSWPRWAGTRSWPSWTGTAAGTPTPGATRSSRTSTSTTSSAPARTPAARPCSSSTRARLASRASGSCARSSTTRPVTTTGASAPRPTWTPPTTPARRCSASPVWASSKRPTQGESVPPPRLSR
jgi:hypothetical protein